MSIRNINLLIFFTALIISTVACNNASNIIVDTETLREQGEIASVITLKKSDFEKQLHSFLKGVNPNIVVDSLAKREHDSNNVVATQISNRTVLTCKLDASSENINDATLLLMADGQANAGVEMLIMMHGLINATNPELAVTDREQILRTLGFISEEQVDYTKLEGTTSAKGVQYSIKFLDNLGILFTAYLVKE